MTEDLERYNVKITPAQWDILRYKVYPSQAGNLFAYVVEGETDITLECLTPDGEEMLADVPALIAEAAEMKTQGEDQTKYHIAIKDLKADMGAELTAAISARYDLWADTELHVIDNSDGALDANQVGGHGIYVTTGLPQPSSILLCLTTLGSIDWHINDLGRISVRAGID